MGKSWDIANEKLLKMQAECRRRYEVVVEPVQHSFEDVLKKVKSQKEILSEVLFFDGQVIDCVKALFTSSGNLRPIYKVKKPPNVRLKNSPMKKKTPKIIRWERVMPQLPTTQKINRPPAVYNNIRSHYGIASEMLAEQLKTG